MKTVKIKIIAILISTTLIIACGGAENPKSPGPMEIASATNGFNDSTRPVNWKDAFNEESNEMLLTKSGEVRVTFQVETNRTDTSCFEIDISYQNDQGFEMSETITGFPVNTEYTFIGASGAENAETAFLELRCFEVIVAATIIYKQSILSSGPRVPTL